MIFSKESVSYLREKKKRERKTGNQIMSIKHKAAMYKCRFIYIIMIVMYI